MPLGFRDMAHLFCSHKFDPPETEIDYEKPDYCPTWDRIWDGITSSPSII
jgi:hypothetical protein